MGFSISGGQIIGSDGRNFQARGINTGTIGINGRAESVAFMNTMATPEMGTLWVTSSYRQSGIKSDASKLTGDYAAYFRELVDLNKNAKYFIGIPQEHLAPQCKDAFVQIINVALPAGLISVDDAVKHMNDACYQQ